MNSEEKDRFQELNEKLYSRTRYEAPSDKREPLKEGEDLEIERSWKGDNLDEMLQSERRRREPVSFMKKLFILALIFFVAAVGIGAYIFFGGANFVSSKNVDITVLGPTNVSAGEPLELSVTITNKNNAALDVANLSVQYPAGTRNPDDNMQSLTYEREALGAISAGGEVTKNIRAALYGEQGETKDIKIQVEYKVKGSNATFYKDKVYEIGIGDSPVTLRVTGPSSVTSGDSFDTTVEISANTPEVIKNVMVRAEYPYGFTATQSKPAAITDDNVWQIGDIVPGDKKTITLTGKLVGENEEERSFRFYVGIADSGSSNFKTNLVSQLETISISRPSLGLNFSLNGSTGTSYVAPAGQNINASVRYQNNLVDKIVNPHIEVVISGSALNKQSVQVLNGGFYDSGSQKIVWNPEGDASELVPGESGSANFYFTSLTNLPSGTKSKEIDITATVTGRTVSGDLIQVSNTKVVKIASVISLSSKVLYSRGPFTNTGPIPPRAEKPTTYTIVFDLGNTEDEMTGSKVTARLGQGVTWTGKTSPNSEDITYDADQNLITWNVGTLAAGAGFSEAAREAVFQVSLTPSVSQIGTGPQLVTGISFTGTDSYTGSPVNVSNSALTTKLSNDPKYVQGDEIVVK